MTRASTPGVSSTSPKTWASRRRTACAELTVPFARDKAMQFSGLLAWLLWRGIYLGKLPGLERKIRVLVDWTVELFFPKDIVQTIDLR